MRNDRTHFPQDSAKSQIIIVLTAALLIGAYAVMRYGGLWGETDTATFTRIIRATLRTGSLVPPGIAYFHGYGFPVLAAFLVHISGISVENLQIFWSMLLIVWIILPAWLAYRELTGSTYGATLATVLILIQPELLFALLRGSHEKFTRGLMFLALYLLVRSVLERQRLRRFASLLIPFYLVIYALITFNNLMAMSFITALGLSMALSLIARWLSGTGAAVDETAATRRRLFYAVVISLLLSFFFTFYAYPPAREAVLVLRSVADRLASLFLEVEEVAVNPYATVGQAWISLPFYFLVSVANWILLVVSFVLWVTQTFNWWRRRNWPDDPRIILLWSFVGAFGFVGFMSILVDFSGALSANLQHRVFPSFAMVAAPYVADWWVHRREHRSRFDWRSFSALAYGIIGIAIAFLGIVAVAKATNEPLLSNKWSYYTPAEFLALEWSQIHVADPNMWTEFDERLHASMMICCESMVSRPQYTPWRFVIRDFMVSDVTRARSGRLAVPLPIEDDSSRIYDAGTAEVYRLRSRTPFQR